MIDFEMFPLRDRRPLAVQVYDRLFDALIRPETEGAEIPTELELVDKLRVSRTTVRQALALLEEDGLLVRGRGRRRLVAMSAPAGTINPPLEEMITASGALDVRGIARSTLPATRWSSALLKVPLGAPLTMWESVLVQGERVVASALEAVIPEFGDAIAERDDATLLAALGQPFRSRAVQATCRIAAHSAAVRDEFDGGIRADAGAVVVTQLLSVRGRPAYLAKHVVRLRDASLTLSGIGRDEGENSET